MLWTARSGFDRHAGDLLQDKSLPQQSFARLGEGSRSQREHYRNPDLSTPHEDNQCQPGATAEQLAFTIAAGHRTSAVSDSREPEMCGGSLLHAALLSA